MNLRLLLCCLLCAIAAAADDLTPSLSRADLDPVTFAEWMDGTERAMEGDRKGKGPAWLMWTRDSGASHYGIEFGDSKTPGPRHMRIGFTSAVPVGTIVAQAEAISVLKPGAAYPGDLGDDSQWLKAACINRDGVVGNDKGHGIETWVLPPGTTTRALRFTHVAQQNDRRYNGWTGAALVLPARLADIAPQAVASASANSEAAALTINQNDEGPWSSWENDSAGRQSPLSPEQPEWVMLTWKEPRTVNGVILVGAGAGLAEVQMCSAPPEVHPSVAGEAQWTSVTPPTEVNPRFPAAMAHDRLAFAKPVTTRGIRVRLLKTYDDGNCHPHINGHARGGKHVWLGEILAFSPLGGKPLTAPQAQRTADEHPPIPVRFHLDKPGLVTLVIEDAEGNRIRNLVSETRFPAGDNTAWWDGLDDRERDYEAADHHQYRIPGRLVAPAAYRVRGLVRDDLAMSYEFSFYNHGTPSWDTADGTGGWLANHSPPQALAFVPAALRSHQDAKDEMLIGSAVTEGGSGLAWVGLDGRKLGGVGWIGGNWSGAAQLAVDNGPKRFPGFYAYVAAACEGELRLTGIKTDNSGFAGVIGHYKFQPREQEGCNGVAVYNGLLVASLPKLNALIFVEVGKGRILGQVPCTDPRGVAFDAHGRLLVLSGRKLVRAVLPADLIERFVGKPLDRTGWTATASSGDAKAAIDGKDDSRWGTGTAQKPGDWFQLDLGKAQAISRVEQICRIFADDFARGYELYLSDDGASWGKPVFSGEGHAGSSVNELPGTKARFIRLVSTGSHPGNWWSIDELSLSGPAAGFRDLGAATLVADGLEDPKGLCVTADRIFISDQGRSHQVKAFAHDGAAKGLLGRAGPPVAGPYDPQHMNNPTGMAVDSRGRLWVTETDYSPKRVSVWRPDGAFEQAFYGPAQYGCGGALDPADKTRLFYSGMEFKLDWEKGTDALRSVIWRGGLDIGPAPEHILHAQGRDYLTNCFNSNPTGGTGVLGIYAYVGGKAVPIASAGRAQWWGPVAEPFHTRMGEFSVRWTGKVVPTVSGPVTFSTVSDDGVRLWVDGRQLIDNWTGHGPSEDTGTITLTAGKAVDIRLEWFQGAGGATIRLQWEAQGLAKGLIPAAQLIPAGATAPGGLRGEFHDGRNLDNPKFTRLDAGINLEMGPGSSIEIPGKAAAAAAFRARLPAGADFDRDPLFYVWSDRNHDQQVQADEVSFCKDEVGAVTVQPDLSLATSTSLYLKPTGFDAQGVPLYDAADARPRIPGGRIANTSGGGNTLICADGWDVLTIPPAPFPVQSSMSGGRDGVARWTYPSLWPGLHPSHASPVADRPGELIGTTRVVGPQFKPLGEAGWCWAINGNQGSIYVFTSDGLFVATLFKDQRSASNWSMPVAKRGLRFEDCTLGQENFWPTITQTQDGRIYVVSGSCIIDVAGLESVKRLPAATLAISAEQLAQAARWTTEQEAKRQREAGTGTLKVALRGKPPTVDGEVADWAGADWATIDRRQVQQGDWGSRLDVISGAVTVSGDRLYAAWRTGDVNLLRNAGTTWQTLFKFGGCLDLMVGADPKANPDRQDPAAGDCRLLVTRVQDKVMAVLYRPVVPGFTGDRQAFTSPVGSVSMDEVVRVDEQVQLAGKDGNFELSVPLALLGLKPAAGQLLKADIGILRGNGFQTMQRCYWSNKATAMTSDVPSEARLTPLLWGRWVFEARP